MELYGEYQTTLCKALTEIDRDWKKYEGLIVAGTHNPKNYDIEKIIQKIKEARVSGRPTLLVCFGHQLGAIEFARNVLNIKDATSEEFGQGTYVVSRRPNLQVGLHNGESYWNNYEVNIELKHPDHFFSTQSHPEYNSSIDRPHPLLVDFLITCKKHDTISKGKTTSFVERWKSRL